VRAYPAAVILSIAAIAACSGTSTTGPTGQTSPTIRPSATSQPQTVTVTASVTCRDNASDADRLQQAIDSSRPGDAIGITGTCLLTKGISLLGDRTYVGASRTGTVLRQDGDMGSVLASSSYLDNAPTTGQPLAIRNLTVECDGSGSTDGIIILNWQVDVEGVDVRNCGGSGIVDTNTAANGRAIDNTSVNSRFENNFISDSGRYGFEVRDSDNSVTDGYLVNNQIASSGADAIHLENAAGWNISGNHLYSDGGDAIYANRLYGTTIYGNHIEDFGLRQTSGTWYGIVGTAQGGMGSTIFNNTISNNKGESAGARYIYIAVTRANYGTGYLSVTGNIVLGVRSSDVGLSFDGGANKLSVASSGNKVARAGTVSRHDRNATLTSGT
jgi:Right handed beta helix region